MQDDYAFAQKIQAQMAKLPFLRDLQFAQAVDYPTLDINIDRERAGQFGLTMADVVRSVVPATSSSRFTQPNYWRDPNSGNAFQIQVELPQNRMQSVRSTGRHSGDARTASARPHLDDIAVLKPGTMPGLIERYNGQRVVSLTANLHGITLGEAAQQLTAAVAAGGRASARSYLCRFRGQIPASRSDHLRIAHSDLLLAILVIFLLLAANFQSVRLASGDSPDSPRGALRCPVRCCGSPRPRSISNPSWGRSWPSESRSPIPSCLSPSPNVLAERAGRFSMPSARVRGGRLRAILMTAAAMIFGMLPMAIGFGEGGAQSAPLGRAVIGGLDRFHVCDANHPAFHLRDSPIRSFRNLRVLESERFCEPLL